MLNKLQALFQGENKQRNIIIAVSLFSLLIIISVATVFNGGDKNILIDNQAEPDIVMANLDKNISSLVYPFVENKGQLNSAVKYYAPLFAGSVYLTEDDITYSIKGEKEGFDEKLAKLNSNPDTSATDKLKTIQDNTFYSTIKEKAIDAAGNTVKFNPIADDKSNAKISYYTGSSTASWQTGIETYRHVTLGSPWNNIELKLRAHGNNVEKLFIIDPNGNPSDIAMAYEGIEKLAVSQTGELNIITRDGQINMTNPVAYQYDDNDKKVYVPVKYAINDDKLSYGFSVNEDIYDRSKKLVIDPLLSSTFLGGSADERETSDPISRNVYTGHYAIVDDMNGDVYVIGHTQSSDYPTTAGAYDETYNDGISPLKNDVVISKFNADLTELLASTYFGGISEDTGAAIDLYNDKIYIAGYTISDENSFPITANAPEKLFMGGGYDGFVAKFDKELISLEESTYFPGNSIDYIYSLTVDQNTGDVYIGGSTKSTYLPSAVNANTGADYEAFITKLNSDLTSIAATRFIGGTNDDYGRMIKLNNDNDIILVGKTDSADFPVTAGSQQDTLAGSFDAFIAIVANDLSTINAATYLGGTYPEDEFSVDILSNNNIVVAGQTKSGDFPTTAGVMDTTHNTGNYDGFISILNPTLTTMVASTFLGGNYLDEIYELKVDGDDWIYVGGYTNSTDFQSNNTMSGTADGFIARLKQDLTNTDYTSTFLGGAGALDYVLSLDTTIDNQLMVFGITNSNDFPTTNGAYDETHNGGRDMYLAKMTKDLSVDQIPSHVKITKDSDNSSLMTATAGATTTQIRISIMDIYNIPIYVEHGNRTVRLSGLADAPDANPSHRPKCQDKDGVFQEVGAYMTLDFNRGTSTTKCIFYAKEIATMEGYASTTDALTIDSTGNTGHSLTVNVSANSNVSSAFSKIDAMIDPVLAGQTQTLTLTTYDIYRNQMGAEDPGQSVAIYLLADSANGPQTFSGLTNNDGVYSTTYTYTNAGIDKASSTVNGVYVKSDTDPSAIFPYDGDNGTRHITAIDHLELTIGGSNSATMASSDTNKTLTISAKGTTGDTVAGYNGEKVLRIYTTATSSPNGTVAKCNTTNLGSNTTLTFTNGVATCILYHYKAGSDIKIDAVDTNQTGLNTFTNPAHKLTLNVNPGTENYYTLAGNKRNMRAGEDIKITINTFDAYGNASVSYVGTKGIIFSSNYTTISETGIKSICKNNLDADIDIGIATDLNFISGQASTTCIFYNKNQMMSLNAKESDNSPTSAGDASRALGLSVLSSGLMTGSTTEITAFSNPQGTCGEASVFVLAKDEYGNILEYSAGEVNLNIAAGSPSFGQPITVTDYNTGMYIGKYTATASGTDVINGQITESCILDGKVVPHNTSATFYSAKTNASPDCESNSQMRTCNDGILSGDSGYQYATCTTGDAGSCYRDGKLLEHGETAYFFRNRNGTLCACGITLWSCYDDKKTLRCDGGDLVDNETGIIDEQYIYSTCAPMPCPPCLGSA